MVTFVFRTLPLALGSLALSCAAEIPLQDSFDPTNQPTTTTLTSHDFEADLESQRHTMHWLLNATREEGGACRGEPVEPVAMLLADPLLTDVAQTHAAYLAGEGTLSHHDEWGYTPQDRVEVSGYTARAVGEIMATGSDDPALILQHWKESYSHCLNIHTPEFRDVGIGYHLGWWVVTLAEPKP